ncbi:MAG: hypothetical protein CSA72_02665 [Rhodobacterales bacterium]|nr:MAG: hypothetical protein CSA72_02665 [Rhodobacterales bacterium]
MKTSIFSAAAIAASMITATAEAQTRDLVVDVLPANNNPDVQIVLRASDSVVEVGDTMSFCFESSKSGYVSMYNFGTSGSVHRIFPYTASTDPIWVEAYTETCAGPDGAPYQYRVTGPGGIETSMLIWTRHLEQQPKSADSLPKLNREMRRALGKDLHVEASSNWETVTVSYEIVDPNASVRPNQSAVTSGNVPSVEGIDGGNVWIFAMGANVAGLAHTDDDARNFTRAMQTAFDVPASNVRLSEETYRKDFYDGMAWLRDNAKPGDQVMLYYSGHGSVVTDDDGDEADLLDEVFIPMDAEVSGLRVSNVIRDDEWSKLVAALPTDNVISIMDACHSGGLSKALNFSVIGAKQKALSSIAIDAVQPMAKSLIDEELQGSDIGGGLDSGGLNGIKGTAFAAVQEDQYALEVAGGGIFTMQLVAALGQMQPGDSFADLFDKTDRLTREASQGRMDPALAGDTRLLNNIRFGK